MPSFDIHQLGIHLEQTNSYLKPQFPADGNNSADYYDYGDNLLLGAALGLAALRRRLDELPEAPDRPGTPRANLKVGLEAASEAITALQNDPEFDVHKQPKSMAIVVHMLHACAAFHAMLRGKIDMYR